MAVNPEQEEELEALKSIYSGDEAFSLISDAVIQYKVGEDGDAKSCLLQISWPLEYPNVEASLSLELFYNHHIRSTTKEKILEVLKEEMAQLLGLAQTFALIEKFKECAEDLLKDEVFTAAGNTAEAKVAAGEPNQESKAKKEAKNDMTKGQKRRMWDRGGAKDERERGWDWVDIIRHLSQTGNSTE